MQRSPSFLSKRKGKGPKRKFDVLIFGATGCLGQNLCEYFSRRVPTSTAEWGIAGRDLAKLSTLKSSLQFNKDLEKLCVIVAACEDQDSILQMCEQTELVINCTSQNLRNCSVVVNACIDSRTDYLDFTTDESIISVLKEKYDEKARENEVLIIPACGYHCLPEDLGILLTRNQFPNGIEPEIQGFVDHTTATTSRSWYACVNSLVNGAPVKTRCLPQYNQEMQHWVVPMPTVTSSSFEATNGTSRNVVRYSHFLKTRSLFQAILLCFMFFIVYIFLRLRLMPFIGPTKHQLQKVATEESNRVCTEIVVVGSSTTQQQQQTDEGEGVGGVKNSQALTVLAGEPPVRKVITKIWGPDIQSFSIIAMAACSLCLLQIRDDLPIRGGVSTPAAVFGSHLFSRLQATGIDINVDITR